MKKWSGGTLIVALGTILFLRYSFIETDPHKQSIKDQGLTQPHKPLDILNHSKKPYLITVDGVDDLYSWTNISSEESKVKLVWAQMHDLISRADSLPGTAQGVKEASIAWKDLVATIEEEKSSKVGNCTEDKNCPFSLSAFNTTLLRNGSLLEFPCGLTQDSSVTVIGVPNGCHGCHGCHGSFQIELIGSQIPVKADAPVILHYNVTLQGDKLTEDPVIVQNTWTPEFGWGIEERCPAHGSAANPKVDGLIRCNEQFGGTVMDRSLNATQFHSNKWLNDSTGSSHISVNFPFVEEQPFTATLWVGLEGFHMTVNGKHETSFAYRENLEPWLVTRVRVAGRVDLLSVLANRLPVSEDMDLVIDIEHLKAVPVSKKRLLLLVGIFSTGNNFERRMALRRSWMQYEAIRSGDVAVRFFIGLHKSKQVNIELWKEAQTYGDIQLMPFVDYYGLITLKTIAICILGTKILPAKYIMKTDDDAFVRIDAILSGLKQKVSNGLLYGLISFKSEPHRNKDSKWYISEEEWPQNSYPPWAHGPGYVISRDIAKFIVQGHQEGTLKLFKLEDVAMGIWIEQFKKGGREVNYINDDRFHNAGCESDYFLAHYQAPRMLLCLWEKLQLEHEPICCE